MNLKQLRHFTAVVDHGGYRKAAEAIHISQPALSLSIQRLEESLHVTLLDRTATKVTPTIFGKALIHRAKHIEGELRHVPPPLRYRCRSSSPIGQDEKMFG